MKRKSLLSAWIPGAALFIILLTGQAVAAQEKISVQVAGHDSIVVINRAGYSITLWIDRGRPIALWPGEGRPLYFNLRQANVVSSKFRITYEQINYIIDSQYCANQTMRQVIAEKRKSALIRLIQGWIRNLTLKELINLLKGLKCMAVSAEKEQINEKIQETYHSAGLTEEQKANRIYNLLEDCLLEEKLDWVYKNGDNCLTRARRRLEQKESYAATYNLSQLISLTQKFSLDITAYSSSLPAYTSFRGTPMGSSARVLKQADHHYYGGRITLDFNAYKNGRRKYNVQYYVPLEFQKSPLVYKSRVDSVFTANTGYSWTIYGIGFGWRTSIYNTQKGRTSASAFLDLGVISSSLQKHTLSNERKIAAFTVSHFKGSSGYINAGLRLSLFKWASLYGSYYGTIFYKTFYDAARRSDVPAYSQYNVGLSIDLLKLYNYQY